MSRRDAQRVPSSGYTRPRGAPPRQLETPPCNREARQASVPENLQVTIQFRMRQSRCPPRAERTCAFAPSVGIQVEPVHTIQRKTDVAVEHVVDVHVRHAQRDSARGAAVPARQILPAHGGAGRRPGREPAPLPLMVRRGIDSAGVELGRSALIQAHAARTYPAIS